MFVCYPLKRRVRLEGATSGAQARDIVAAAFDVPAKNVRLFRACGEALEDCDVVGALDVLHGGVFANKLSTISNGRRDIRD